MQPSNTWWYHCVPRDAAPFEVSVIRAMATACIAASELEAPLVQHPGVR